MFIPLLPFGLREVLQAPVPFLVGVLGDDLGVVVDDNVIIASLDDGTFGGAGIDHIPKLPCRRLLTATSKDPPMAHVQAWQRYLNELFGDFRRHCFRGTS